MAALVLRNGLQVATGEIDAHSVAKHQSERLVRREVVTPGREGDDELDLVVQLFGGGGMPTASTRVMP